MPWFGLQVLGGAPLGPDGTAVVRRGLANYLSARNASDASQTAIATAAVATIHRPTEPPAPRADSNATPASATASSANRVPSARRLLAVLVRLARLVWLVRLALVLAVPPTRLLVERVLVVPLLLRLEILLLLFAHGRKDLRKSAATIFAVSSPAPLRVAMTT
jgi:hypothetical protein